MTLLLVSTPYLSDASSGVRAKTAVSWEGYARAGLLSTEEVSLIKKVDRQPRNKVDSILLGEGQVYATLYAGLLKKVARIDTLQYVLVMLGDVLADHEERLPLFMNTAQDDPDLPYGPLLRTLVNPDEFAQLKALQLLTIFLNSEPSPLPPHYITPFLNTISSLLSPTSFSSSPSNVTSTSTPTPTATSNGRDLAVQCLSALLPRPEFRSAAWEKLGVMAGLVEIMNSGQATPQMNYQVAFCFWLFSFDESISREMNKKYDIILLLTTIAKTAVKEKVIRVIVATFRNLLQKSPSANLPPMLLPHLSLLPFIKNLLTRKWSDDDEEIVDDLEFLKAELKAGLEGLSTYDAYKGELESGHLGWTALHESEAFWKENATRLNEEDFAELKVLITLLKTATESTVLAVACHDLGQYVKYCEGGKKAVDTLDGKTRVMELMSHDNEDVRFRALITVQRLVSHAWAV